MIPKCNSVWWGPTEQGRPGKGTTLYCFSLAPSVFPVFLASILLLTNLFTGALASECGLDALLLTGLQVKGVALDLFNNVFLLHLALETAQSILEGFTLLQSNFCQAEYTPKPVPMDGYYVTRTG
jgi:hypothetical protein